jgi:hypothetical protein
MDFVVHPGSTANREKRYSGEKGSCWESAAAREWRGGSNKPPRRELAESF